MAAIKRTLLVLFLLTSAAFAAVWIHFIQEGKSLDASRLKLFPLRVIAYPTFVSHYGPGPILVAEFEKRCGCKVELLNAGDSSLLVEKIQAKGDEYVVDVVLGLDQLTAPKALETLEWREIQNLPFSPAPRFFLPMSRRLIPFDWAPMTFIYKKSQIDPPRKIADLLDPRFAGKVSVPSPLTSTPGRQFFQWIATALGEEAGLDFFSRLADQNFIFPDSWTKSYGLLQKGPVKMSFSYLTSAVYHWVEENDFDFQPVVFEEPVPLQVEYAGVPTRCRMCAEAEDFVRFLLEPGSQSLIMQKNYMLPVLSEVLEGTEFEKLPELKTQAVKDEISEDWIREALKKVSPQ